MSATTSATTALNTVETVLPTIETLVGMMFVGKLSGINSAIQGEVKVIGSDADAIITQAKTALDNGETGNAAVTTLVTGVFNMLKALGIALPDENTAFAHLHAVVADLEGVVMPVAAPTAAA